MFCKGVQTTVKTWALTAFTKHRKNLIVLFNLASKVAENIVKSDVPRRCPIHRKKSCLGKHGQARASTGEHEIGHGSPKWPAGQRVPTVAFPFAHSHCLENPLSKACGKHV